MISGFESAGFKAEVHFMADLHLISTVRVLLVYKDYGGLHQLRICYR